MPTSPEPLLEWWLKQGVVYGVAIVFLSAVLMILIWVAVELIRLLRKWIPLWFQKNMEAQDRMIQFLDAAIVHLTVIRAHSESAHLGLRGLLRATNSYLANKELRERLDIPSDVIIQLRTTEARMRDMVREEREWRGDQERHDDAREEGDWGGEHDAGRGPS